MSAFIAKYHPHPAKPNQRMTINKIWQRQVLSNGWTSHRQCAYPNLKCWDKRRQLQPIGITGSRGSLRLPHSAIDCTNWTVTTISARRTSKAHFASSELKLEQPRYVTPPWYRLAKWFSNQMAVLNLRWCGAIWELSMIFRNGAC